MMDLTARKPLMKLSQQSRQEGWCEHENIGNRKEIEEIVPGRLAKE